jgi:hypothetical protein
VGGGGLVAGWPTTGRGGKTKVVALSSSKTSETWQ